MRKGYLIGLFVLLTALPGLAQLQANFTVDKSSGCSPLDVRFTNTTSGTSAGVTYKWDFGNGNSSTLVNPGATYSQEKTYTITLTASNGGINSTISKTITVYKKPVVDFTATPVSGCVPMNVSFNGTATPGDGTIVRYLWDFGDGNTAEGANLTKTSHTYTIPQQPPISLTVTNSFGCYTTIDKGKLVVALNNIQPSFTASPTFMCSPQTVHLTNTSTGVGNLSYLWDFGDGTTDSAMSPSHKYNSSGNFTIRLTVKSDGGCSANAKTVTVRVGTYKADFSVPALICAGQTAFFSNRSTRPYDSLQWKVNNVLVPYNKTYGNMSYRFNSAGTYTVQLIAFYDNCVDTATKTIQVGSKPDLNGFLVQSGNDCDLPVTFTFTDTSQDAVKWEWRYQNNTTVFDTSKSASLTFTTGVDDRIGLTVTDAEGCAANGTKRIVYYPVDIGIIIKRSTSPDASPNRGCPGLQVTFGAVPDSEVVSYAWNFGDGAISDRPEPSHTYNTLGSYQVSLDYVTRTGCKGTAKYDSIYITDVTASDFFVSPSPLICGNSKVIFTPTVLLPNRDYIWLINGAEIAYALTPGPFVHQFDSAGVYTIALVVRSGNCMDTVTKVDYVTVTPPFPDIQSALNTCDGPRNLVVFTDTTRQSDSWTWDFGDGSPPLSYSSFQPTVDHIYDKTGTYTATLTGTNGACTVTDSLVVNVLLKQDPQLSATVSAICNSDSLLITVANYETNPAADTSQAYVITGLQFGDLTFSNARIDSLPWTNSFTGYVHGIEPGKQDLRIITRSQYFDCADTSNFIRLTTSGPIAGFSFDSLSCFKDPLVLKDTSKAAPGSPIVKWEWVFGDSTGVTASNGNDIIHQYEHPGTYQLGLRVTDAGGCSFETPADSAHLVTLTGPDADFEASAYNILVNDTVFFKNTSLDADSSDMTWVFSDGSVTTDFDTYFYFASEGDYTVKLIAKNRISGCSDTAIKVIHVKRVESIYEYSVSYPGTSNCPPMIVDFISKSLNASTISWVFGDGGLGGNDTTVTHVYTNAGTYRVVQYSWDSVGHVDSSIQFIEVKGPYATLKTDTLYGCNGLQIKLSADTVNATSFKWDFGDGVITNTSGTSATHIYGTAGVYTPAVILSDSAGCSATSQLSQPIIVDSLFADFTISPDSIICDSAIVSFTSTVYCLSDERFGSGIQYQWTSAMHPNGFQTPNATWNFNRLGSHDVTLAVNSAYGCKTILQKKVDVKQGLIAGISAGSLACSGSNLVFLGSAIPSSAGLTWQWDLGNTTSDKQNPDPVVYTTPGAQPVSLIVSNDFCSDTAYYTAEILANPLLALTASKPYLCLGDTATITATGGGISCAWSPAVYAASNNGLLAVVKPSSDIVYTAIISDSIGCTTSDSIVMEVKQPIKIQASTPLTVCAGNSVQMNAAGAAIYQWSGEGFSSTLANPVAMPVATTTYQVVGYDGFDCFADSTNVFVQVNPLPTVDAGPDQKMVAMQEVILSSSYSGDVIKWNWSPARFLSCYDCPSPVAKPLESIDYLLTVTNGNGCTARDTLRIEMICGSDQVYIPTAFTPNGDNLNDKFNVHGSGIRIKRLAVFDRWGKVVFERKDISQYDVNAGWDGNYNGMPMASGAYVYMFEAVCEKGESFVFKGTVTLIR